MAVTSRRPNSSSESNEKLRTERVDRFILEQIETVPHLEALLLEWKKPRAWSIDEMAAELYVPAEQAARILRDLSARGFLEEINGVPLRYKYASSEVNDRIVSDLDDVYRRDLIRISRMIHQKAPSALRDFARAFRLTKEKE
ncbi:MAG TPA: hypothetical protein VMF66_06780 [Candidatus Acidoferrum sp.]|nr:hypothetical protein [Candidatus Acidoferrum sp.]